MCDGETSCYATLNLSQSGEQADRYRIDHNGVPIDAVLLPQRSNTITYLCTLLYRNRYRSINTTFDLEAIAEIQVITIK
jgi:hypothetical protein